MISALTYQEMLNTIQNNSQDKGVVDDFIGVLLTRPDLDTGRSILNSLEYYHHLTGENINFYLPGFGAYWGDNYPDKRTVAEVEGIQWYFSAEQFVLFVEEMQKYSKWSYSGESELLLMRLKDGTLTYDGMLLFYLDDMLRDEVIDSIPKFFQQLSYLFKDKESLNMIGNSLGKDKAVQIIVERLLEKLPYGLGRVFTQEKYFCVKNMQK